jgi:hypothetical protein
MNNINNSALRFNHEPLYTISSRGKEQFRRGKNEEGHKGEQLFFTGSYSPNNLQEDI